MIIREDKELEKMVVEEGYHIAVPFQIIQYADGRTDFLVYSFCEQTAKIFSEKFSDPFSHDAVSWLKEKLFPVMNDLGYDTDSVDIRIHREYRLPELPSETEQSHLVELLMEITDEDRSTGMDALEEFVLDPDDLHDRMTVIRENGSIIAFAAVNDMQEDDIVEITVECDENHRRKGYGKACVAELARYFMNHGREVKYLCDETNTASAATAESAGFKVYSRVLPLVYYRQDDWDEIDN